jgi:hypothetical protein
MARRSDVSVKHRLHWLAAANAPCIACAVVVVVTLISVGGVGAVVAAATAPALVHSGAAAHAVAVRIHLRTRAASAADRRARRRAGTRVTLRTVHDTIGVGIDSTSDLPAVARVRRCVTRVAHAIAVEVPLVAVGCALAIVASLHSKHNEHNVQRNSHCTLSDLQ